MLRAVSSTSAAVRLDAAAAFLRQFPASTEVVVVGATRGAADDFVRRLARRSAATFGLTRFGLTELAARSAVSTSSLPRRAPATQAGAEAVAARAAFDAVTAGELGYFTPVASMPGFPRALARTLHELRLAGIGPDRLGGPDAATEDIGRLLARVEAELARVGVDDRAALFRRAANAVREGLVRWASLPILLLDVPLDSQADAGFVEALASCAPDVLATIPDGDVVTESVLARLGAEIERRPDDAREGTDLFHLRRHVFLSEPPPARQCVGDVRLFSAPGEGREAVEIVRRILDEAEAGVPFDEMAVFLRTPQHYLGLLEHACARAGVPAYFDRGIRRPDPAGRAFIALLSCAVEGLSARRFDEYLSLGQVPRVVSGQWPVASPRDEMFAAPAGDAGDPESPEDIANSQEPVRD